MAQAALGRQLLDQSLEGHVLMRVRPERQSRARAAKASANDGSPDRSVRSTSMLTKKPMRSSVSRRVRPAMGVPTHDVFLPGVAR